MRKLLLSLLLASAAASPALAAPDNDDREQTRAERQAAREERQQAREERQQQAREPRADVQVREPRAERQVEFRARGNDGPARAEAVGRADGRDLETIRAARSERRSERQELVEQRRETVRENRALRQSERAVPHVLRDRAPIVSSAPREGTQPPLRAESRRSSPVRWSSHWRNDRRYDWRNWRNRHRSLFRLGFYYDPFGWGYRPYSIGWRLWPSYYGSRYWLNDPWQYRLPYAPPGYRWIRYYNDAILVDTWNGQVVDVLYNFFW